MREVILFSHIPKTGGSSLRQWFFERLPRKDVFWIGNGKNQEGFRLLKQIPSDSRRSYLKRHHLVGGHVGCFDPLVRDSLRTDELLFTCILRDPFERLISHFAYASARERHPLYTQSTFLEAFDRGEFFFRVNSSQQNRFISGSASFSDTKRMLGCVKALVGCHANLKKYVTALDDRITNYGKFSPSLGHLNANEDGYQEPYQRLRSNPGINRYLEEDQKLYDWLCERHGQLYARE